MEYESLAVLIEPFIHMPLNELPDAVRKRVGEAHFLSLLWDSWPDKRHELANQYDSKHDPAMEPEHDYWFELMEKIRVCEGEIRKWELMQHQSISEAVQKETKLLELNAKMAALQLQYSAPYTAPAQNTATPVPVSDIVGTASDKHAAGRGALWPGLIWSACSKNFNNLL